MTYFILPSERRLGFGKEAHAAIIQWLRDAKIFEAMHAQADADNIASIKILLANGFKKMGRELAEGHDAPVIAFDLPFDQTPVCSPAEPEFIP